MSPALEVITALAGALVAVFVGGAVIGRLLHPFAVALETEGGSAPASEAATATRTAGTSGRLPGLENAGRMIGWLERTLLYGLILAGAPDAAAVVIAAKSIARFPAFSDEKFAEYYLIGTLLSFLIAAGLGAAVRAALGLHPLLSGSP